MATALITGASSGIGLELAREFARHQHDLILVARSQEELEKLAGELQTQHGITCRVIRADLTIPAAPRAIADEVAARNLTVDYLVNNAGYGNRGLFHETPYDIDLNMVQINVGALTALSKLFLPGMVKRRHGGILNIASTAAFLPGPLMAVYYATKAYVRSFSEALANEAKPYGVTVTALCPGPTTTGFGTRAGAEGTRLFSNTMSAETVARQGYRAFMRGQRIFVPGWRNKVSTTIIGVLPRALTAKLARWVQER